MVFLGVHSFIVVGPGMNPVVRDMCCVTSPKQARLPLGEPGPRSLSRKAGRTLLNSAMGRNGGNSRGGARIDVHEDTAKLLEDLMKTHPEKK